MNFGKNQVKFKMYFVSAILNSENMAEAEDALLSGSVLLLSKTITHSLKQHVESVKLHM
jgi:hypothetical protein